MLRDGGDPAALRAALDEWHRRPNARPGLLPHLYDDAVKATAHRSTGSATRSARGEKVRAWLALADQAPDASGHRQLTAGGTP